MVQSIGGEQEWSGSSASGRQGPNWVLLEKDFPIKEYEHTHIIRTKISKSQYLFLALEEKELSKTPSHLANFAISL